MTSTFTTNIGLENPANGDYVNSWNVPVNKNMSLVDQKFGYTTTVNVTGASGTVALTQAQLTASIINLSGAQTGNATFTVPSGLQGYWYFINGNSASSYTTTIASAAGGSAFQVTPGLAALLYSDGANIRVGAFGNDGTYFYTPTPPLGDISAKLATTSFVFTASQASQVTLTGNTTLSSANAWPINVLTNSGSTITLTFPSAPRLLFSINNTGTASVVLSFPSGTDFKGGGTSVSLLPGETVLLAGDGSTGYYRTIACGLSAGLVVGYRNIPLSANSTPSATDVGKYIRLSSGTTINSGVFNQGDAFVLLNTTGSAVAITQGAGTTLRLAGTTTTGSRSLAAYGEASVLCDGGNVFYISGAGVS